MRMQLKVHFMLMLIAILFIAPYVFEKGIENGDLGESILLILVGILLLFNLLFVFMGEKILK